MGGCSLSRPAILILESTLYTSASFKGFPFKMSRSLLSVEKRREGTWPLSVCFVNRVMVFISITWATGIDY